MSVDMTPRYFDVQACVGAIPVEKSQSTDVTYRKLSALDHHPGAIQKETSDTVGKMDCAEIGGADGPNNQKIFRLHGVSREECPPSCHYLQNGIDCILYLIMLNKENARLVDPKLAMNVILG